MNQAANTQQNLQSQKGVQSLLENGLEGYLWNHEYFLVKLNQVSLDSRNCHAAIFDKNGSNIIYIKSNTILIAKLQNLEIVQQQEHHRASVNSQLQFLHDNVMISCSKDKTIVLWRFNEIMQQWCYLSTQQKHTDSIKFMILNKDETQLLAASADTSIIVWSVNLKNNSIDYQYSLQHHQQEVKFLSSNPSESYLVSYSKDQTVAIWSINNWEFSYVIIQLSYEFEAKLQFLNDQTFICVTNLNHEECVSFYE